MTDELFLLNLFITTHPFKMILYFIDTLHVTLFQNQISIDKPTLIMLIFNCFLNRIQISNFSLNLLDFTSTPIRFIQNTCLFLVKIIISPHSFKIILIFIDTLHVTLFQKSIFIFNLPLVLIVFNLYLNCIQIKRFSLNIHEFVSN